MKGLKFMLEQILSPDNLNLAYSKVARNKGTYGIDGMTTENLFSFLENHGEELRQAVINGTYSPQPVRAVKIPKGNGKFRTLGIPTAIDRLIQRAIVQVLMPLYEFQFSETSYGFRPEKSIEDAVKKCQDYFNQGYIWVVDMDLEKFFDSVSREKLMNILCKNISDERILYLIEQFINAGIIEHGQPIRTHDGISQGGPLSPLLANIMLNELDQELMQRCEKFVRYADDMLIFCRSSKSAHQALKHITPFIEEDLFLRINNEKTMIASADRIKFLGYGFCRTSEGFKICIHESSIYRMKEHIIKLAKNIDDPECMRKIQAYITSWISHYRLADIGKFLYDSREWLGASLGETFIEIWLSQQEKIH